MGPNLKFYYFNSTHWDREWFQSQRVFQRYLVSNMAGIMESLENGCLEKYIFDGQTIVLEDVLEIRPDWKPRLEKLVSSGKLKVGPWYVMPDEFLVSGEALIRNLLLGSEIANEFGSEPWQVGYVCDIFGHIAQMPQIFSGFDCKPAVLWRGVKHDQKPLFFWESPDGSKVPAIRLFPEDGYGDFSLHVTGRWDKLLTESEFKSRFQAYVERVKPYWRDSILLSDGLDHIQVHSQVPEYFKWIQDLYPDSEIVHTDYSDIFNEFKREDASTCKGELIHTAKDATGTLISHTLSSRYDLKSLNDQCTNRLELETDTVSAILSVNGVNDVLPFRKLAWKKLLQNHPHDSICGCSIDAVHRQMVSRYEEVDQICSAIIDDLKAYDWNRVTGKSLAGLTCDLKNDPPDVLQSDVDPNGCYTLRFFNPLPREIDEVRHVELLFPSSKSYPEKWGEPFGYEKVNSFRIFNLNNHEIPYGLGKIKRNSSRRFHRHEARFYDVYDITMKLKLEPCGWTTYNICTSKTPVRYFQSISKERFSSENDSLKVTVNRNGTFNLQDKRSGRTYSNLNDFVIDSEIGDGWNSVRAQGAGTAILPETANVRKLEDSPDRTIFEIVKTYMVPNCLEYTGTLYENYSGITESHDIVSVKIATRIIIDSIGDSIKLQTDIYNTASDCRIRLVVPTGIPGEYSAYQNFAFISRQPDRKLGATTENYIEAEPIEKNFSGIVSKSDSHGGIAFIDCHGLHEVSASNDENGELYITLLRAFCRTVSSDGEPEGQLHGRQSYEYALKLIKPDEPLDALWNFAQQYRSIPYHYMLPSKYVINTKHYKMLSIEGDLSFSVFKPVENILSNSVVLRLINLSDQVQKARIQLAVPAIVTQIDLSEKHKEELYQEPVSTFSMSGAPWELISLKLDYS